MKSKYYLTTTIHPVVLRFLDGLMYVFEEGKGWTESSYWYSRVFFSDFTEYKEINYDEAMFEIGKLVAS